MNQLKKANNNNLSFDNKQKGFYYNCKYCKYATSKTSHYKRHLKSFHLDEYYIFLNSQINPKNKGVTFLCKKIISSFDEKEINDSSHGINKNNEEQNKNALNLNYYKNLIRNAIDYSDHLSSLDNEISDYYWHTNKKISDGAFSTSYLGEDIKSGLKVIILETKIEYIEEIRLEKYILNKIKGFGNFPPLYDTLINESNIYLIEGFMGFDIHTLFKICDHDFDLITIMNIGIDLLNNIKILHDRGFIHRDLKPDNIVYGPM